MAEFPQTGFDPAHDPDATPRVATSPSLWPLVAGVLGALGLGTVVFLQLSANRAAREEAKIAASHPAPAPVTAPAPAYTAPPPIVLPASPPPPPPPAPVVQAAQPPAPAGPSQSELDHLRAPALVVDLGAYQAPGAPKGDEKGAPLDAGAVAGSVGGAANANLKGDERFAMRLGLGGNKPVRATSRLDLAHTVVEGAIIPAVLETALNSDLPGYVRAVVSRDIRGFDGSLVLIPRGSRLIGQYNSGVALGQSRAFVIWIRLIRPDGATIDLASPATDGLGRGGLNGDVNRHFLQRFGGAMLLTLLNLGANAATQANDTAIVIASTRSGSDAASQALSTDQNIAPTVTVPQGSPVRVFVSQDMDFSDVGPAGGPAPAPATQEDAATAQVASPSASPTPALPAQATTVATAPGAPN
ncbi:MAG: type VI secretion protein [Alphaproteobacteria bacterium]|nr:type VI secretion protein [Alphaproteobacteria bacterium]